MVTASTLASQAATASIVGGVAGGAVGGAIATGDAKGAFWGGVTGGAFKGVDAGLGGQYSAGRVVADATVGGVSIRVQGGDFWRGAGMSGLSSGAEYAYRSMVKYGTDWRPGGPAQAKRELTQMPYKDANNIGTAMSNVNPDSMWGEGGIFSQALNVVPGINAVAGMHDVFQVRWSKLDDIYKGGIQLRESLLLNVAGMPVAAAMTYPALLQGVPSTWIAVGDD